MAAFISASSLVAKNRLDSMSSFDGLFRSTVRLHRALLAAGGDLNEDRAHAHASKPKVVSFFWGGVPPYCSFF